MNFFSKLIAQKKPIHAVVLAAGKGERMKSNIPKPLIPVGDVPMLVRILYVVSISSKQIQKISVIIPAESDIDIQKEVNRFLPDLRNIEYIFQDRKRDGSGTGGAFCAFLNHIEEQNMEGWDVLVLNSDAPFLRPITLQRMIKIKSSFGTKLVVGVGCLEDPHGCGRVFQNKKGSYYIVEENELNQEQRQNKRVNSGIYLGSFDLMKRVMDIQPCETTGEKKLTDILSFSDSTVLYEKMKPTELLNVNTPMDKVFAEFLYRNYKW